MNTLKIIMIKNQSYYSLIDIIFIDTDSLINEIKAEDIYEDFSTDKEMFDFSNYSTKSKYYDNSNKVVNGKRKVETRGVAIEDFIALKPKLYSFVVDYNEYKKVKGVNKNAVAILSHNRYV